MPKTDANDNQRSPAAGKKNTAPRYRTILADPPWDIQQKGGLGAIRHYPLMTLDQIEALPVERLAADDAHLWLWTTNAALESAYGVARAWGFTPRSLMTWTKPRLGLGNYLRNCTEHVVFATRGRAPIEFRSQPTWMFAPLQEHSHKPEELYAVIERCSPGPFLELFARRRQPGWDVWGNEVESDVTMPPTAPRPPTNPARGRAERGAEGKAGAAEVDEGGHHE